MNAAKEFYRVPMPDSLTQQIVVYGTPGVGQYEWRVEEAGRVLVDTEGHEYRSPEVALRDALVYGPSYARSAEA